MSQVETENYVRYNENEPEHEHPKLKQGWSRYFVAELMGSYVCTVIACGVIASVFVAQTGAIQADIAATLYPSASGIEPYFHYMNPLLFISVGIGLSFTIGMLVAPEVTLNPAFALCVTLLGAKPWRLLPIIILGQIVGSTLGALTIFAAGHQLGIDKLLETSDVGIIKYASMFGFTPPPEVITNAMAMWSSIVFTAIIVCVIIPVAIRADESKMPFLVGVLVTAFACAQQPFGVSNNPALTMAGLLTCTFTGYHPSVIWTAHDNYWLVAFFAPFIGSALGVFVFKVYAGFIYEPPSRRTSRWTSCSIDLFVMEDVEENDP